jgi:hypothetical protein
MRGFRGRGDGNAALLPDQPTALRAQIDGHTRIKVDLVATLGVTHPRGG